MESGVSVRSIESAAYRCWPARECVVHDGWELRYADGFSRRGNSVYPAEVSTLALGKKLDWCRRWYSDRGLDLVFRETPATEPGLDEYLDSAGFLLEGRTHVMTAPLVERETDLGVARRPAASWWRTTADLWGFDLTQPDGWAATVNRIDRPAGFVCVDGAAAGLAVVDGGWLGLFEIVVHPDRRRAGLGSAVTRALLEWGRTEGASGAYLQVVAGNLAAIGLYASLEFEQAYSYWYRRDQAESANKPA